MPERDRAPRENAPQLAVEDGWAATETAQHYARARFASRRATERDPKAIERLLHRHLGTPTAARVLDVPHGTGRLAEMLQRNSGRYVGLDRSQAMLAEARALHAAPLIVGSVEQLPFPDDSFDAVVCCRLLHHLDEERQLPRAIRELVRVSRGLVLASFWDAGSLHAWRRRVGLRRDGGRRWPVSKLVLERTFQACGARVVDYEHGLRFVSMQTFAVARKQILAVASKPA